MVGLLEHYMPSLQDSIAAWRGCILLLVSAYYHVCFVRGILLVQRVHVFTWVHRAGHSGVYFVLEIKHDVLMGPWETKNFIVHIVKKWCLTYLSCFDLHPFFFPWSLHAFLLFFNRPEGWNLMYGQAKLESKKSSMFTKAIRINLSVQLGIKIICHNVSVHESWFLGITRMQLCEAGNAR